MGNCQAAEAATVVIQHPGNKIERVYWSVSANEIMNSNPGHYVALVVTSPTLKSDNGASVKQLKLLRPNDTLLIGHVYRLVSFEDVLKEFAAKKCVKLGKLLEKGGLGLNVEMMKKKKKMDDYGGSNPINMNSNLSSENCTTFKMEQEFSRIGSSGGSNSGSSKGIGRHYHGVGVSVGQWRPALQSIAEVGT